jgi:hypothetical protein
MKYILVLTAVGFLSACASTIKTEVERQPQQVIGQVDSEVEKKQLLKTFLPKEGSAAMQINETLFNDKVSKKNTVDYYPAIKSSFIKKANDQKSKLYKYLRIDSLSMIDGRNPTGIEFPIKSEDVTIFGTSARNVNERERCNFDEKTNKEICSQGWHQNSVLLGVKRTLCHNSGCDTDSIFFIVNVTQEAEQTEGSSITGRDYKVISPSYINVSVDSPYKLEMPYTQDYQ